MFEHCEDCSQSFATISQPVSVAKHIFPGHWQALSNPCEQGVKVADLFQANLNFERRFGDSSNSKIFSCYYKGSEQNVLQSLQIQLAPD